ncbi:uncharacterized protein [Salminus brasiliensis]|uniref:uncharacterized protein isoform X1 n=1 Tax=Salminus brasiliensis TaxID=930266 RepID=UPI003B82FC82
MEGEMKERRKIQFSVPSAVPTQLDPKQVEMIRRRRPTPATLFRMTDHPSPEEENPGHQLAVCENGLLMGKRVNTAVYQPPSLTAVQKMVEAHMQSSETDQDSPSSETSDNEEASPDSDRDDSRSDQLEHHPGNEVPDEERGPALLHDVPGENNEGESKEEIRKKAESTDNGDHPPDDTRSDQSEHHSTCEVTDKGTVPTLLYDVPWEGDTGSADTDGGVNKSAESSNNGESMEKGED